MQAVILIVHLLIAFALILVVLMQRSEGGGLGIGGGGGIMTSRGAATALSKVTWALGIAFVITSLALTVLSARGSRTGSVLDTLGAGTTAPATAPAVPGTAPVLPTAPDLQGDLLPKAPAESAPAATAPAQTAPADETPAAPPPVK